MRSCVVACNRAISEKVGLLWRLGFLLAKKTLGEAFELKVVEYLAKLVGIRLRHFQLVEVKLYWHVGSDGREKLRHLYVFLGILNLFPYLALYLVGMSQQVLRGAKLVDELCCRFLTHTWASRVVVGRVAHQCEQVYHVCGVWYAIFFLNVVLANLVVTAAVPWAEHEHVFLDELPIVLVGREHICLNPSLSGLCSESTNHVVGLEALCYEDGNVHGSQYVLDDWH